MGSETCQQVERYCPDTTSTVGRIFDIKRFALHDGPGIRTTVFTKGCPLRCAWCHNPESISPEPALAFMPDRCIGCGACLRVCPRGAHRLDAAQHVLDRQACAVCGLCAAECPAGALELVGREVTVGEVMEEVLRDRPYYQTSGGGLTVSGGEPTSQVEFTESLLQAAADEGLHRCLDTCGHCSFELLQRLGALVDLWLFDYKETDPARHVEQTGVSNELILDNLRRLHATGAPIRLRCPIIPGLNDRADHFEGIARLAKELADLESVEIMPYHRLGEGKGDRFGLAGRQPARAQAPTQAAIDGWIAALEALGVRAIESSRQ